MLSVSKEFHQAFIDSEREVLTRVSINGTVYPQNSIKSIDYSMGAFGGDSFQLGSTQSATVKILFTDIIEGLKELDEVKVEIGIKIRGSGIPSTIENVSRLGHAKVGRAQLVTYVPDRFEFISLGTFYISGRVDPDRNEKTTTIEARDGFLFMENDYQSKLSYPAPLSSIALEIANQSGVAIDPISFNHLSTIRIGKPEGYTYRQAIGIIAQYQVGFASFDREGHLAIKQLNDPRFSIHPSDYFMKGLVKNELIYQPKGITCKVVQPKGESTETITLQAGSSNGAQINLENNTMTQALLNQLFEQVKSINYYPISLKWRGNPAVEVGDWVTMTDRKGKPFKSPILNYALKFDGGLSGEISADSKAYSGNVSAFKGPLQQKLDELDYRVDAAGKNNVYSGTEKPSNPKEGDIWFKKNGPDDEIWVYQQVTAGAFEWVMTTSTRMPEEIKERIENATPKDEIVKTINLSSEMNGKEWLKIKGAKLWLTNETKIDNAVITSAMIAEVDAGKIHAGTLDASQITVTNLNANSISTGIAKGKNLSINFDTGAVYFSSGQITNLLNKINIDLDKSLIYFSSGKSQSSVIGDNGFLVYKGIPPKSDVPIYDENVAIAVGVYSRQPALVGNGGIEISAYEYYKNGSSTTYTTKGSLKIKNNGDVLLTPKSRGTLQLGLAETITYVMSPQLKTAFDVNVGGNLNVVGSKNAIQVTREGVRATPAYETAESYLGDIGRSYTKEDCSVWVPIDTLFSDTVNTDVPYEVFLQNYDCANVWVADFKSNAFLVCSTKPNVRFAWELKAKRLGYENERLELQEFKNEEIERTWGDIHGD